jgi:hypothetical protein
MQLHDGKLWKCPLVAYLGLAKERFALSEGWDVFQRYRALEPTCSRSGLLRFSQRESEEVCALCPAQPRSFVKPDPLRPHAEYPRNHCARVDD